MLAGDAARGGDDGDDDAGRPGDDAAYGYDDCAGRATTTTEVHRRAPNHGG